MNDWREGINQIVKVAVVMLLGLSDKPLDFELIEVDFSLKK